MEKTIAETRPQNLAVALRSQYRQIIFASLICFAAETVSYYPLSLEFEYIYVPGQGIVSAPNLWILPGTYAYPLLLYLNLAIPLAVLLLLYLKTFQPAYAGTWIVWILAIPIGSIMGGLAGWYLFVSYTVNAPFYYSWYAYVIFSGNWLEMSLAALTGILASNLKRGKYKHVTEEKN